LFFVLFICLLFISFLQSVFSEVVGSLVKDGSPNGTPVLPLLEEPQNYPLSLRFGIPRMSSNEKIILASTFHTVFAFSSQVREKIVKEKKMQNFIFPVIADGRQFGDSVPGM